jgi:hypothetical protein
MAEHIDILALVFTLIESAILFGLSPIPYGYEQALIIYTQAELIPLLAVN